MGKKKKQENTPREYWKQKGFDCDEEFSIYQYLCGNLSSKRKVAKEKQFYKYKSWQEHVEGIINNYDEETLSEFYHFIKLKRRQCDIDMSMYTSIFIPLVIALIAGWLIQCVLYVMTNPNVMINSNVTTNTSGNYNLNVLAIIFGFVILLVLIFVVGLSIRFLFHDIIDPYIKSKNETSFWEDCLEIVEKNNRINN